MKKLIALTILFVTAAAARAQWIVYDPAVHTEQILSTAQQIAKYVEMINNQAQQIHRLTDQLNEFKHYEDLFGNPASVLANTMPQAKIELITPELGQNLDKIISGTRGASAFSYDENGIFHNVGATFVTPLGNAIHRAAQAFAQYAAINSTTRNFLTVSTNAAANRAEIKKQIAATVDALGNARTDAEVQKLSATLTALSASLNGVDHEVNQALGSAVIQSIENRNDEQKQIQAQKEQQQAEFHEVMTNYAAKFQLLDAPVHFPTAAD